MSEETSQRAQDAEAHRKSYEALMRFSSEIVFPFALALTMFFTNLVLGHGLGVSILAGAATYGFIYFVVKTFFSH
jgi:hypothetical protein